jgi:hypothetical protein
MIDSRKLCITPNDYEAFFEEMRIKSLENELNSLSGQQRRRIRRKLEKK